MTTRHIQIPDATVARFCRRWEIREFSLFGSVLRDDFRPESDIDVVVSFQRDAAWSLFDLATTHIPELVRLLKPLLPPSFDSLS